MHFEQEYERKVVHLHHDQNGERDKHRGRLFANTLCKMNSAVPDTHITTDPSKVTCKICRKDRRFALLLAHRTTHAPAPEPKVAPAMRYRRTWRGKLVLQVEVICNHMDDLNGSGYYDEYQTRHWRDATLADLNLGVA